MSLLFAIDYDGTWTRSPALIKTLVKTIKDKGNKCVCITSRSKDTPDKKLENSIGKQMPIVYAAGKSKRTAAENKGYRVDIWLDNEPEAISKKDTKANSEEPLYS